MDTPELVEIVNPNGRKGFVAAESDAAKLLRRPPSTDKPTKSATKAAWVAYATAESTPGRLEPEAANAMTQPELVAAFESEED